MRMTLLMAYPVAYPDRFSPIANIGKLAAGIEIPSASAPEQMGARQFNHARPGAS